MPGDYTRRDIIRGGAAVGLVVTFGDTRMAAQTRTARPEPADLILLHGRLATLDERRPWAAAAAIKDGRFVAVGSDADHFIRHAVEPKRAPQHRRVETEPGSPGVVGEHDAF